MFDGFESRRVDVGGGIVINAFAGGSGPPVLLLHGYPQCVAMWGHIAPLIAKAGLAAKRA